MKLLVHVFFKYILVHMETISFVVVMVMLSGGSGGCSAGQKVVVELVA